jgi:LPXTG-motif cell wall-anchored protein
MICHCLDEQTITYIMVGLALLAGFIVAFFKIR